jgi:hypothetical protein
MTAQSHYDELEKLYKSNHEPCDLERMIQSKQAQAWDCHQNGAYGSAREQMIIASLARQLLEQQGRAKETSGWKSPPPTIEELLDTLPQDDPRVQDIRRMYKRLDHLVQMDESPPMIVAHLEWCNAVLEAKIDAGERGSMYVLLAEALADLREFIEPPRPAEPKP